MADSLKDVIAKLKAQQMQVQKPVEVAKPNPIKQEIPEYPDEDDEDEEIAEEKKVSIDPKDERVKEMLMTIEMLQNDGRFRAEMLNQMQEINKALITIANIMVSKP
jgi:hypothetical protein